MILFFAFGPMLCYFLLLFYAGLFGSIFGTEWIRSKDHLLFEYLLILFWYYQLGLFGTIIIKLKNYLRNSGL